MIDLYKAKADQLQSCQGLALRAAELSDAWLAINSQFVADLMALQFAIIKHEEKDATQIHEMLDSIWAESLKSVSEVLDSREANCVADIVSLSRDVVEAHISELSYEYFTSIVAPADSFSHLELNSQSLRESFGLLYFSSASSDVLASRKLFDAEKLYAEYYALKQDSLPAAFSALYSADKSFLEAWLIECSKAAEDDTRGSIAIKFALVNAYLHQLTGIPTNIENYELLVRGAIVRGLGPDDGKAFAEALPKLLD